MLRGRERDGMGAGEGREDFAELESPLKETGDGQALNSGSTTCQLLHSFVFLFVRLEVRIIVCILRGFSQD